LEDQLEDQEEEVVEEEEVVDVEEDLPQWLLFKTIANHPKVLFPTKTTE
jgi:hypothetical protein